ncbi:hypothetical protein ACGFH8_18360 [Micromonospora sp. NPDC049175]|uniref:hypothetical protein n=1 Tax=Micromonospora sp. NPDC049175 TaxID=3364266 RepID=UPI0037238A39
MEAPNGIRLGEPLGVTDRGSLWRAHREPEQPRIIRFVGQRFSDRQFRDALAVLRQREHPRMAPIAGHGFSGSHYYVEYEAGAECRTLEEGMSAAPHWRDRLLLLRQVCDVLPQWLAGPVRPLGLNLRNIVLRRTAGRWYPWLLPCPPVSLPSPRDLLGVDRHVLAAIAPEAVRGIHADPRAQDWYALGTLAAQAAGCAPGEPAGDDAVTDQARNALLHPAAGTSEIPAFLEASAEVRSLFEVVRHYRFADPAVRPAEVNGLQAAIDAVTDVLALAEARRSANPDHAVEMLSWLRRDEGGRYLRGALLAAEVSAELGDVRRVRDLVGEVLDVLPGHLPDARRARRLRADALWQLAEQADPPPGPDDPASRELLADLDALKSDRDAGTDPYLRAARLYRRWHQPSRAADELYAAAEADPSDLEVLRLYRECWLELGEQANATEVSKIGHHRADRMRAVGMLTETEAQWWHEAFDRPLS